jgi:hypothetical protein
MFFIFLIQHSASWTREAMPISNEEGNVKSGPKHAACASVGRAVAVFELVAL